MSFFHENGYATYYIRDGILQIDYKQGVSLSLPGAIEVVEDRLRLQEGLPFPVLCDIRGIHEVDKSARDYLAIEGSVLVSAVAYIVEPTVSKALSEFFLHIHNPPVPSESFANWADAMEFLETYKGLKS